MSMPSDVTPDISDEAVDMAQPKGRGSERWSAEQQGLVFAALVAFLGVAYVGPTIRRMARRPRLVDRAAVRLEDARKRARKAGAKVQKRARRLGGGSIR